MYYHLKVANEQAQKELINLKNKLIEAKMEDILNEDTKKELTKNELKQKILLANEDLSLENPVDRQQFEDIKTIRNRLKSENAQWFTDFRKKNKREPTREEYTSIQEQLNEFDFYNKRYIVMKAKQIR